MDMDTIVKTADEINLNKLVVIGNQGEIHLPYPFQKYIQSISVRNWMQSQETFGTGNLIIVDSLQRSEIMYILAKSSQQHLVFNTWLLHVDDLKPQTLESLANDMIAGNIVLSPEADIFLVDKNRAVVQIHGKVTEKPVFKVCSSNQLLMIKCF